MKIAWFSCGVTSAIACKLSLEKYPDVELYYMETGSHHPDNKRFIKECENWYGKPIKIIQSAYQDHFDVVEKSRFINSPFGARCTTELKIRPRQRLEQEENIQLYILGFDITEIDRARRFQERYPDIKCYFPLIEQNLTKENCLCLLKKQNIEIPVMYKLGYHNNNCIGCVKGGAGYWNKIRKDFPVEFERMAKIEREINHSCLKNYFLDELPLNVGNNPEELQAQCSLFCNVI